MILLLLLGYIYGVGFGLTVAGEAVYYMVVQKLKCRPSKLKMLVGLILWPIAWIVMGLKLYKVFKEELSL